MRSAKANQGRYRTTYYLLSLSYHNKWFRNKLWLKFYRQ